MNEVPINAPNQDGANSPQALAEKRARDHQQMVNRYHRVFNHTDGIIVMADLSNYFKLSIPAFAQMPPPAPYDPYRAAVLEGQRSVLLRIQQMLREEAQGDANAADAARAPVRR